MAKFKSTWIFGKVAETLGLITGDQAAESAEAQEELEGEGISLRFGEVLVEGMVLSDKQVQEVMKAREETQPDPEDALFGTIAAENGFLDPAGLKECLQIQQDLTEEISDPAQIPKIGEILLTEERMDPAAVEAVLKVQQRLKVGAFSLTPSKMLLLKKKKTALKVRSPEEALFCKAAVRRQMLFPEQVAEILQIQMADPRPRSVGEIAYELGYMDQMDVASLREMVARKEGVKERKRRHQTTAGIRLIKEDVEFSVIVLKNGFISKAQLKRAEKTFKLLQFLEYPRNLGEIFFDSGLLSTEQIRAVLDIQRLKGAVLPAYRLEEILLTEKEDDLLADLIKAGDRVNQDQVTECLKIQRELRKTGIHRKIGEIMLVKGYLFREDLKRRPMVRRERVRGRQPAGDRREGKSLTPILAVGGAAFIILVLIFIVALAWKEGPAKKDAGQTLPGNGPLTTPEKPDKHGPDSSKESGPASGKDPVEQGYIDLKGRWIHKEKFRALERKEFYEALRRAVSGR